jgi:large subunit ribosomal protein L13
MKNPKTYQPTAKEVKRNWHHLDAEDQILGRLSTQAAKFLMGKHKSTYSSHMDSGDFVVIKNAEKIQVTGRKENKKTYYRHSGYPGGFRETTLDQVRAKHPTRILEYAIYGMLPGNRLRAERMKRLKIIVGNENPYENQK